MSSSSSTYYNFARGHPNPNLIPVQETKDIFRSLLQSDNDTTHTTNTEDENRNVTVSSSTGMLQRALNYGPGPGGDEVLVELARFLDRQCHSDETVITTTNTNTTTGNPYSCQPQHLFITSGVSHGLDILAGVATQPGDLVLTETPTYYLVGAIFASHHLQVQSLPMKSNARGGVDVAALAQHLESGQQTPPRMIYLIPTHQNPTGHVLSLSERQQLAKLAVQYNILILADEVYHLLDWRDPNVDGLRPGRMVTFNDPSTMEATPRPTPDAPHLLVGCVSVSSFTKIYGPGVRCGWIEGSVAVIQACLNYGYIQSQDGVAPLMGEIMRRALVTRTVDHVMEKLCHAYQRRSQLLYETLTTTTKTSLVQVPYGPPKGGYFLWIEFPETVDVYELLQACHTQGLQFMPGPNCNATGQSLSQNEYTKSLNHSARLCFADMDEADLKPGAERLLSIVESFVHTKRINEN